MIKIAITQLKYHALNMHGLHEKMHVHLIIWIFPLRKWFVLNDKNALNYKVLIKMLIYVIMTV